MKKILSLCTAFLVALSLFGCSKPDPAVTLEDGVEFELTDVMKIQNDETNSVYYYYMATITNDTDDTYSTKNVIYTITDNKDENLNPIDQHESMPITRVMPEQTAYVYGYIGFPNNNQNDMGFYFKDLDQFVSFNSVDVREANNHDIKDSKDLKFTIYEDKALRIEVDGTKCTASFADGSTTLSDFKITYTNKTDRQIVVPYLEPKASLNGLLLTKYSDKGDFSTMSEEDLKKVDFTTDGLSPKTESIDGESYGYAVEYLDPEQNIECNIGFIFNNGAINYASNSKDCFDIQLVSSAFGITHKMTVSYQ